MHSPCTLPTVHSCTSYNQIELPYERCDFRGHIRNPYHKAMMASAMLVS